MVLFNYATKEITAKIVYYGPGLCGKTTNLQFVYDSMPSNNKSKMLSLATKTDRTLFFDFLPLDLGKIRGMRTKLQLYTVPGQVYYNSTRQLVLKGADGIVFVADSQDFAVDANNESLQNLEDNLKRQGIRIREVPMVIQYNKRDLPNAMPIPQLEAEINRLSAPHFGSVATTGIGVEDTLKGITHLVLTHLVKKYGLDGSEPLDREIQILNATVASQPRTSESLWDEDEGEDMPGPESASAGFVVEDGDDAYENIPSVATELIGTNPSTPSESARSQPPINEPFGEIYFGGSGRSRAADRPGTAPEHEFATEVPMTSIEIPLPEGILNSLPDLGSGSTASAVATPLRSERRANDGLVKEITVPLNLTLEELKQHRRLRLKITLDVNLLS